MSSVTGGGFLGVAFIFSGKLIHLPQPVSQSGSAGNLALVASHPGWDSWTDVAH